MDQPSARSGAGGDADGPIGGPPGHRWRRPSPTEGLAALLTLLAVGCLLIAFLQQDLLGGHHPLTVVPTTGVDLLPDEPISAVSAETTATTPGTTPAGSAVASQPATGTAGVGKAVTSSAAASKSATKAVTTKPVTSKPATGRTATTPTSRATTSKAGTSAGSEPSTVTLTATTIEPSQGVTLRPIPPASAASAAPSSGRVVTSAPANVAVPCSRPSPRLIQVTFIDTLRTPVRLEWSTPSCTRATYGTIRPGGSMTVLVLVGSSWAFVDPATGRVLGSRTITDGTRQVTMP